MQIRITNLLCIQFSVTVIRESNGHRQIWWGDAISICNELRLHTTIFRKSITFACVH